MTAHSETIYFNDSNTFSARFADVRAHSVKLSAPLSDEDCCAQSMPDASPVKWHLAHTTWFFETFILEHFEPDFEPFHPAFRVLFNSYYNAVGERHTRAQRGLLTRPSMSQVKDYRRNVDARIHALLALPLASDTFAQLINLLETGLQHEQQHQELMMTDVLHLLSCNPLRPAYAEAGAKIASCEPALAQPMRWLPFDSGVTRMGCDGSEFCFDNEMPVHRQFVESYEIASRLVTNGEYLAFVEAGGYRDAACWLSEGWDWLQGGQISHPLYWEKTDDNALARWTEFSQQGQQALDMSAPVTQLSFFEADAYARWAGARLPTEAEWEHAANHASAALEQLFGYCWQWTSSSYTAYPGYRATEGALGEYNGKFMSNQYVLRGSSCFTPQGHSRISYRNFFPSTARWQFSGIRLAR